MKYTPGYIATLDCQDETDVRGPLGMFLSRTGRDFYRRYHPHRLIAAGTHLEHSALSDIETRNIYVEQLVIAPTARATSAYQFHFQDLPEEVVGHGIVSEVFPNPKTASWDPELRRLDSARGLGVAICLGRANGAGLVLLIGIDSKLQACCAFDTESGTPYTSNIESSN
jgi:hypothetical protein